MASGSNPAVGEGVRAVMKSLPPRFDYVVDFVSPDERFQKYTGNELIAAHFLVERVGFNSTPTRMWLCPAFFPE